MKLLIDCDILGYCLGSADERRGFFDLAAGDMNKPVYSLPVFELCRSLHLLVKLHNVAASDFRACWAKLSDEHLQSGELFVHVTEFPVDNLPRDIVRLRGRQLAADEPPCEDTATYWDRHHHLVQRLRWLHPNEDLAGWWMADPPGGRPAPPCVRNAPERGDLVMDANNLLELLNTLPVEGMGVDIQTLHLPSRLSQNAVRRFKAIIQSYGAAGHFIVPICVLEETEWVANRPENLVKYQRARAVLGQMSIDLDKPLWNIFDFEPITQEVLDHFIHLYECLTVSAMEKQGWGDFGDMLVLAFGLYHGTKIATNEWFEGKSDVWHIARGVFPQLVLE